MQLVVLQAGRFLQITIPLGLGNGMAQVFILLEQLAQVPRADRAPLASAARRSSSRVDTSSRLRWSCTRSASGACSAASTASSTRRKSISASSTTCGLEVTSILSCAAASSIKSMALSGRQRSLM